MNTNIKAYLSIIQHNVNQVISVIVGCAVTLYKVLKLALNRNVSSSVMVSTGVGMSYFVGWEN